MPSDAKWEKEAEIDGYQADSHRLNVNPLLKSSTLKVQAGLKSPPAHNVQRSEVQSLEAGQKPPTTCLAGRPAKVPSAEGFPRVAAASWRHRSFGLQP